MNFQVKPLSETVNVEPGSPATLGFEVHHDGPDPDLFEVVVEGVDPEWSAIPVPTFTVQPGGRASEKVVFNPPRVVESVSGDYPFVLNVRSLNSGHLVQVPLTLSVKPFHHLSVDVSPKKAVLTPTQSECTLNVTILNLGNSEHEIALNATDNDDDCSFEFVPRVVTVGPGQEKTAALVAATNRRPLFANPRLVGFTATARSSTHPAIAGTVQGQIEQRALASPGFLASLLLLLTVIGFWIWSFPKPPTMELAMSKESIMLGDSVTLDWQYANATAGKILANDEMIKMAITNKGTYLYKPDKVGEIVIIGYSENGRRKSPEIRKILQVKAPPVIPDPEILAFKAKVQSVALGSKVVLEYAINDAVTKLTLYPTNTALNVGVRANEIEVDATREGDMTFTLAAENAVGKVAQRSLKVVVVKSALAKIIVFRSDTLSVTETIGTAVLEWQIVDAVRAEISDGTKVVQVDSKSGAMPFSIDRPSKFTLTAYDKDGMTVKRVVQVSHKPPKVEAPPTNPENPPNPDGSPNQQNPPAGEPQPTTSGQ